MNELTPGKIKKLFLTIEINLVICLVLCGMIWTSPSVAPQIKHYATIGMIIAALLQHWAYYDLYKKAKE